MFLLALYLGCYAFLAVASVVVTYLDIAKVRLYEPEEPVETVPEEGYILSWDARGRSTEFITERISECFDLYKVLVVSLQGVHCTDDPSKSNPIMRLLLQKGFYVSVARPTGIGSSPGLWTASQSKPRFNRFFPYPTQRVTSTLTGALAGAIHQRVSLWGVDAFEILNTTVYDNRQAEELRRELDKIDQPYVSMGSYPSNIVEDMSFVAVNPFDRDENTKHPWGISTILFPNQRSPARGRKTLSQENGIVLYGLEEDDV